MKSSWTSQLLYAARSSVCCIFNLNSFEIILSFRQFMGHMGGFVPWSLMHRPRYIQSGSLYLMYTQVPVFANSRNVLLQDEINVGGDSFRGQYKSI